MEKWIEIESTHYVFHYKPYSYAYRNITKIIEEQEQRFEEIIRCFPIHVSRKIAYWLCDTREEIAQLVDTTPTNGIFCWNDLDFEDVSIYVVYNEIMQCTGYHEETHAITHFLNEPSSSALAEGAATFMEKTWWGIDIALCTYIYCLESKYISVEHLICKKQENGEEFFWTVNESIAYPIMGAFVAFLLSKEENNPTAFLELYQYQGYCWKDEIEKIYNCRFYELEINFLNYINNKIYTIQEIQQGKECLQSHFLI